MYITLLVAVLSALVVGTISGGGSSIIISAGEVYWNNVLPKTSMPKAIKDLLPADKALSMTNYKDHRNKGSTAKVLPPIVNFGSNKASTSDDNCSLRWLPWNQARAGCANYQDHKNKGSTSDDNCSLRWLPWNQARAGCANYQDHQNKGSTSDDNCSLRWLPWNQARAGCANYQDRQNKGSTSDEEKFLYNPTFTTYFFEEDLRQGNKMRLSFPDTSAYGVTFISNAQSKSIPFSSSKHPNILSFFSINLDSALASAMKGTLAICEYKQMEGENKHCATSLESMVDFTTSVLNTHNLVSLSTTTDKEDTSIQEYELTSSYLKSSGDNTVVCHAQTYAYAVFYCHKHKGVKVFDVEMAGADGTKVKAVATCHTDTSKWNPDNLALKILNVKPGTVPVCHFLPQYDVLWMTT